MISAKNRLPREAFRSHGYRTRKTPFFLVKERINEVGVNRIGVVVAKSVDKRASQRNFFERQVKSQFLKAPNKQKDFIVTLFPGVTKLTKRQFSEEIVKIFEK